MRILFDLSHPAHVHLFKNAIMQFQKNGHDIQITSRKKDITTNLLEAYGFDHVNLGTHRKGTIGKAYGILQRDYRLYKVAKEFKPDILVGGVGNLYIAHVSKLLGKPSIIFDDTEHAYLEHLLCDPFATIICTPYCFNKDLGPKQIRYNGYKELAYLHPKYFSPRPSILEELGLVPNEPFFILRFVAWSANHDLGHYGITIEKRQKFVNELMKYGKVMITSEKVLPEFERYQIKIAPKKMHDLLSYAALYIGEGGTMATEAAILGTPSIHISTTAKLCGNFDELHNKYKLIHIFSNDDQALDKALQILEDPDSKKKWMERRNKMLMDKIDVTEFITNLIENFPVEKKGKIWLKEF